MYTAMFIHLAHRRTAPLTEPVFWTNFFFHSSHLMEFGFLATVAFGFLSWDLRDLIFSNNINLMELNLLNSTWACFIMTELNPRSKSNGTVSLLQLLYCTTWICLIFYTFCINSVTFQFNNVKLLWNYFYSIMRILFSLLYSIV